MGVERVEERRLFAADIGVDFCTTELTTEESAPLRSSVMEAAPLQGLRTIDQLHEGTAEPSVNAGMEASGADSLVSNGNSGWITSDGNIVEVHGTNEDDTVVAQYVGAPIYPGAPIGQFVLVTLSNSHGVQAELFAWHQVGKLEVHLHDGDDTFTNLTLASSLVEAGDGNDVLTGGGGVDDFRGRAGDDALIGGGSNDLLYGGDGNDAVSGGSGDDVVAGNNGVDIVNGNAGNDTVSGGLGDDWAYGGDGNDLVSGDGDDDQVYGGDGNDDVRGGQGDDSVNGNDGNDEVSGHSGDDVLTGGAGNDELSGGSGSDTAWGGSGNDVILGGSQNDELHGGSGNDELDGGTGVDNVHGDSGIDSSPMAEPGEVHSSIEIEYGEGSELISFDIGSGLLRIEGDNGNDVIHVEQASGKVEVSLNSGSPVFVVDSSLVDELLIYGLGGHDEIVNDTNNESTIFAGSGDDVVIGGSVRDEIYGDAGDDSLSGRSGNDVLSGGDDHDAVFGGYGSDMMFSGTGNDRFLQLGAGDFWMDFDQDDDAAVYFKNRDANWSYEEIEQIDTAFAAIVRRTGNNTLLKTHTGHSIDFYRDATHPKFAAQNFGPADDKEIIYYNNAFDASGNWTRQVTFHELAHNWDQSDENGIVGEFRAISGWTTNPDYSQNNPFDPSAPWLVPVGNGWARDFHKEGVARAYGGTHPVEDYATAFAALMMDFNGDVYTGHPGEENIGLANIPQKAVLLNSWLDSI